MIASSEPPGTTPLAAENADRADASKTSCRVTAQRGPNTGSEGLCDKDSGTAAAATAGDDGADAQFSAAMQKPTPRRRAVNEGIDICDIAEAPPAEPNTSVLKLVLIRSLARQKELNEGIVTQVVVSPPAERRPAKDNPRRVVVQQSSTRAALVGAAAESAAAKATAGTVGTEVDQRTPLMREALSLTSEPLRYSSSSRSTTTTMDKLSAGLQVSASNNNQVKRGWYRCRWVGRLLDGYSDALETRPLTFKCATSAFVGGLGDVAAQAVSWTIRGGGGNAVWHDAKVSGVQGPFVLLSFLKTSPVWNIGSDPRLGQDEQKTLPS